MNISVSDAVTTAGVLFVGYQVWQAQLQLRASFEGTFSERYDRIVARIPLEVLLGEPPDLDDDEQIRAFFDYFELCEEELYYRQSGRVGGRTWNDWWEGIALHLRRDGFQQAWERLTGHELPVAPTTGVRQGQFTLLRAAQASLISGDRHDPRPGLLSRIPVNARR